MSRIVLQPKFERETAYPSQPFDFISKLTVGETISTSVVLISTWSGTDTNPNLTTSGPATVQNLTQVWQQFSGGNAGSVYELQCFVTTSLGQTLEISAYLAVITDVP